MNENIRPWEGTGESDEVARYINEGGDGVNTPETIAGRYATWMAGNGFDFIDEWLDNLEDRGAKFDRDEALIIAKLMVSANQRSNL